MTFTFNETMVPCIIHLESLRDFRILLILEHKHCPIEQFWFFFFSYCSFIK